MRGRERERQLSDWVREMPLTVALDWSLTVPGWFPAWVFLTPCPLNWFPFSTFHRLWASKDSMTQWNPYLQQLEELNFSWTLHYLVPSRLGRWIWEGFHIRQQYLFLKNPSVARIDGTWISFLDFRKLGLYSVGQLWRLISVAGNSLHSASTGCPSWIWRLSFCIFWSHRCVEPVGSDKYFWLESVWKKLPSYVVFLFWTGV
jgi:hypothetical protein